MLKGPIVRKTLLLFLAALVFAVTAAEKLPPPAPILIEKRHEVPVNPTPGLAASLAFRTRLLRERNNPDAPDWNAGKAESALKELLAIAEDMQRLEAGNPTLLTGRTMLMAYHSELDESNQPYSLYIPDEYDGSKPFPLIVFLHGQGMFNPIQCNAPQLGKNIVVAPQGRGGMDYLYVAEGDVLRVIDEVQSYLKIDPDRVVLAGASMGGAGSWHLSTLFPDRFAGIMPVCGKTNLRVFEELWYWRTPQDSPVANVRQFLRENTTALPYAGNLSNLKIISLHGDSDNIVDQLHGRYMEAALKDAGHPDAKFHFLPFVMHGLSVDYAKAVEGFVRDPKPKHVHYTTGWLKYPGAYWLKITGISKRLQHATIDGVCNPDEKTIEIKTTNVSALEIDRERLPFQGAPSRISIDGSVVEAGPKAPHQGAGTRMGKRFDTAPPQNISWKYVKSSGGAWERPSAPVATETPSFPTRKNAVIEGPVEHAFMSRFLIVSGAGTRATLYADPPPPDEMSLAIQHSVDDFVNLWKYRYGVPCRVQAPVLVTEQDVADSNLILFGKPEDNGLLANIVKQLPVSFEPDCIKLGDKTYNGQNLGAIFCYPNPLNPQRYVVVIAGTTPQSYTDIHARFGNWFDWVGADYKRHYDFAIFDDKTLGRFPETFLAWGFFGDDWKLSPELTFPAAPAFRDRFGPRAIPAIEYGKLDPLPETLYLDELPARGQNLIKEYLERNRNFFGQPLALNGKKFSRGLCARFPHSVTFDCRGYSRFKCSAGVWWDCTTEVPEDRKRMEKVTLTVQADGKEILKATERSYSSDACEIDVELNGARTITLSASGGFPWLNGSFVWADARLEGPVPLTEKKDNKPRKSKD
jgi:hypothetical protein